MIDRMEFVGEMKRMADTFGPSAFSPGRLDAIWEIVEDLEVLELRRIVKGFIRRARQAPLPEDFDIAARSYRKQLEKPDVPLSPDCRVCRDVGFFQTAYHDHSHRSLMRCPCERGLRHPQFRIPRWEKEMRQVFVWWPCEPSWFEPVPGATTAQLFLVNGSKQIENWIARLRVAEAFWLRESERLENQAKEAP